MQRLMRKFECFHYWKHMNFWSHNISINLDLEKMLWLILTHDDVNIIFGDFTDYLKCKAKLLL